MIEKREFNNFSSTLSFISTIELSFNKLILEKKLFDILSINIFFTELIYFRK